MNKYNIKICGWEEAVSFTKNYSNNEKVAIISIRGSKKEDNEIILSENKNIKVLKVYFEDIRPKDFRKYSSKEKSKLNFMTMEDAVSIKNFVDECVSEGITNFLVHCYAGISRSGAVGIALAKYLNKDDFKFWLSGKYHPNRHCLILMYKALNIYFDEVEYKYKCKIASKKHRKKFKKTFRNFNIHFKTVHKKKK